MFQEYQAKIRLSEKDYVCILQVLKMSEEVYYRD
jgi:hypothetical protein